MLKLDISNQLFGHDNNFVFFRNLYKKKKYPKISLFSGKRGIGKFTLSIHFIASIIYKNYDIKKKEIADFNNFINAFIINSQNLIILDKQKTSISIDDIRELKKNLTTSNFNKYPRFIVLNNIENFNLNCLNALLKILEEPSSNIFFILINNYNKKLLPTIKSRCIEFNIFIKNEEQKTIVNSLIKKNDINTIIDYSELITPGDFVNFNKIANSEKININNDFTFNFEKILLKYKSNKDINYINLLRYLFDHLISYRIKKNKNNFINTKKLHYEVSSLLNNYLVYNLNTKNIIERINTKINE